MKSTIDEADEALRDSRWQGMRIAFDLDKSNQIRPANTAMQLYAQAVRWFQRLNMFRKGEILFFFDEQPTKKMLRDHKQVLEALISEAQEISRRIRVSGRMIKRENGFTVEDLEAAIEELETTKLQWHGGMSRKKSEEILAKVFDA